MALDRNDLLIAGGGAVAFLFGWRRLAGVVWGLGGLYELNRGKKLGGGIAIAGGTAFALVPDWPEALISSARGGSASSPKLPPAPGGSKLPPPIEISWPNIQKVSFPSLDRGLDGGWTMLDVRDIRDAGAAARAKALKPGDVVSLVLRNKNGRSEEHTSELQSPA